MIEFCSLKCLPQNMIFVLLIKAVSLENLSGPPSWSQFTWTVGWWWLPDIFLLKVIAELSWSSHSSHQHHLFLYSVLISILVRIVLCKPNGGGNAVLSALTFILFIVRPCILKTLSFFVSFEASTLRFIYAYKNGYVEVVVCESIWLLFFDRAVTRGSILSSFIESCGRNGSQP